MKPPKFIVLSVFILCFYVTGVFAAAFEYLGGGARARAMGDSYSTVADDGYCVFWNHSALAAIKKREAVFMYRDLYGLGLVGYSSMGLVWPLEKGGVGFGFNSFYTSSKVDFMDYKENTYIFAYGRDFSDLLKGLYVGAGAKYYYVNYSAGRAASYGLGVSVIYRITNAVRTALVAENVNHGLLRWDTGEKELMNLRTRAGFSYSPDWVTVAAEVSDITEDYPKIHLGVEKTLFKSLLALRTGIFSPSRKLWSPTFGGGVSIGSFTLDYALDSHRELGSSHLFSLKVKF